jgi:hypothetical protein
MQALFKIDRFDISSSFSNLDGLQSKTSALGRVISVPLEVSRLHLSPSTVLRAALTKTSSVSGTHLSTLASNGADRSAMSEA